MIAILQVAIGLIFIFSLFSILTSAINAMIIDLLDVRSRSLRRGIESLITDPQVQAEFLAHPLINLVKSKVTRTQMMSGAVSAQAFMDDVASAPTTKMTWIEPRIFADVITTILSEKAELTLYAPLLLVVQALPESEQKRHLFDRVFRMQASGVGIDEVKAAIHALPQAQQPGVLDVLQVIERRRLEAGLRTNDESRLLPLLEGLRSVNDDAFQRALKAIVGTARTLDEAQGKLEFWFDSWMGMLSDLYRRYLAMLSLIVGLVLALILNADSLQIAKALWNDEFLRATVGAAAEQALESGRLQEQMEAALIPPPTDGASTEDAPPTIRPADAIVTLLNDLLTLNIPIGWEYLPVNDGCIPAQPGAITPANCSNSRNLWLLAPGNNPDWLGFVFQKIVGIAITVIAIMQGAPFWFDLLRRLVNPNRR